jgi:hypothetical protein
VEQQRHPEAVVEHGGGAGGRLASTMMTISRLGFEWGFVVGDVEEVGKGGGGETGGGRWLGGRCGAIAWRSSGTEEDGATSLENLIEEDDVGRVISISLSV